MSQIITAIAILAVTVMPAFAADLTTQPNPQHLIMMAYHRNVANFGHTLYQAAEQGSTVPTQVARVAVAEMRRSTEEMEKHRAMAMKDMQVTPRMQKMMDQHLVQLKTHLRELDELAKKERIDSAEVMKQLQSIFEGCEGAGCGMMPGGPKPGAPLSGRRRGRAGGGCGCFQAMPERDMMMDEMMHKMKSEDAELEGLVQEMQAAPMDRKLDLVSEVVARMVRQRAAMREEMERMQRHMKRLPPLEPGMMQGTDDGDEDEDDMDMEMDMHDGHPR
ncbi:MAG TPA: hypothetical protein DCZ75_00270 [Geobacter sp.]|nr:hypothetical protein [Geobacter sp.]